MKLFGIGPRKSPATIGALVGATLAVIITVSKLHSDPELAPSGNYFIPLIGMIIIGAALGATIILSILGVICYIAMMANFFIHPFREAHGKGNWWPVIAGCAGAAFFLYQMHLEGKLQGSISVLFYMLIGFLTASYLVCAIQIVVNKIRTCDVKRRDNKDS